MSWLVTAFVAVQGCILSFVNRIVPDDYMDEIFHGPQAREYCRGAFTTWHPKITTFPGIYYLGTLYGWARWATQALVSPVKQLDAACDTPFLRSLNVLLSAACLLVLRDILTTYRHQTNPNPEGSNASAGADEPRRRDLRPTPGAADAVASVSAASAAATGPVSPSLHALLLALYPLHWFFSFLYYTDVASLLFLLLAQLQAARRRYLLAALTGALAVLCRQTNAVWAAFLLGEAALAELELDWAPALRRRRLHGQQGQQGQQGRYRFAAAAEAMDAASGAGGKKGTTAAAAAAVVAAVPEEEGSGDLVSELGVALGRLWRRRLALAARLWPLLLPPAGFAAFLVANGGSVVLGDKEAHKPVRHGAQLLYFGGWAALMLWPQLLPALGGLCAGAARRPLAAAGLAAAAVATAAAVGHVSTMVHPYMLADNRHYVFYLWRRLLGRNATAKFALAPAYAAAWALLLGALRRRMSWLWVGGFLACLVVSLLPAWLLELRYFTPGFFLIALRLQPPSRSQAAAMFLMYGTINAVTMYLFLFRPYEFADGSVGRFLW